VAVLHPSYAFDAFVKNKVAIGKGEHVLEKKLDQKELT
jgi:hypothetical protein